MEARGRKRRLSPEQRSAILASNKQAKELAIDYNVHVKIIYDVFAEKRYDVYKQKRDSIHIPC